MQRKYEINNREIKGELFYQIIYQELKNITLYYAFNRKNMI